VLPPTIQKKLGEILVEQRFCEKEQIDEALGVQETQRRKRFGEILVELGFATHKTIAVALAMQWGIPFVDLTTQQASPRLVQHVPAWFARRWRVMPVSEQQGVLTVAVTDPIDHKGLEELRRTTGLHVVMVLATPQDITRAITAYYPKSR
jgi:type IV pilus assembly protein PilB